MADTSGELAGADRGWQQPTKERRRTRIGLYAWRLFAALLSLSVLAVFAYLIMSLLFQPPQHLLVFKATGTLPNVYGPTVRVAGRELALLEPIGDAASYAGADEFDPRFDNPVSLQGIRGDLARADLDDRSTLIVYVAAHGVSDGGEAHLVCNNFDPSDVDVGLVPLSTLLRILAATPAQTKFLILDAGQFDYAPRLGIIANDFPRILEQAVYETGDERLWVLCSHSNLERSHHSAALGGSVFGTFVAKGLVGAADANENRKIDTHELATFVRRWVNAWVRQSTAGAETQYPLLFCGDANRDVSNPGFAAELLDVDSLPRELARVNVEELVRNAQEERVSTIGGPDLAPPTQGLLDHLAAPAGGAGPPAAASIPELGAQASMDGSDQPDDAPPGDTEVDRRRQLSALLDNAWRVRDELANPRADATPDEMRPVDSVPHLWRAFQEQLVNYEQGLRHTQPAATPAAADVLRAALSRFWVAEGDQSVLVRNLPKLLRDGQSRRRSPPPIDLHRLRSLALSQLIAGQYDPAAVAKLDELKQLLDGLIDASPNELNQKVEELKFGLDFDRYYELRLVKQLADAGGVEPTLFRHALQVRRDGEYIAASEWWCAGWLDALVAEGDRLRLAAERRLLDQIGSDWPDRSAELLDEANRQYTLAAAACEEVHRARRLRSDLAFRAPYYVQSYRYAEGRDWATVSRSINEFLDSLQELSSLLDAPTAAGPGRLDRLKTTAQELVTLDRSLDEGLNRPPVEALAQRADATTDWQIERLLGTPLPSAADRRRLLQAEGRFYPDVDPDSAPERAPDTTPAVRRLVEQSDWEMKLAQLADWNGKDGTRPDHGLLVRQDQARSPHPTAAGEAPPNPAQEPWGQLQDVATTLPRFYRDLPRRIRDARSIPSATPRREAHGQVVRAQRALRSLAARDAWQFRDVDLASLSRSVDLHDLLVWHRRRFLLASVDAASAERAYLASAADDYSAQALTLLRPAAPIAATDPLLEIQAPPVASLVPQQERNVAVIATYRGAAQSDAWVILEYDPARIEVSTPADVTLYHEHNLPEAIAAALNDSNVAAGVGISAADRRRASQYPYRPDLVGLSPTFAGLVSGDSRRFEIEVLPRTDGVDAARVIVKAIAKPSHPQDATSRAGSSPVSSRDQTTVSYVRQSIAVPLRVVELVVDGPANSWRRVGDKLVLHSYPNRVTQYQFGIVNHGAVDRQVQLKFFAPESPVDLASLSDSEVKRLTSRLQPAGPPLTIAAPPDGELHLPAAAGGDEQPPAEAEAPPSAAPPPAAETAEPPTGPRLKHGLLVEVSDPQDPPQKYVEQIEIIPQRPRRYVRPVVAYNARLERIEVSVAPRLESALPPGPVEVVCEIAEDSASATEGKLRDVVAAPDYEAHLFAYVPASPPQVVTLYLHVDGCPRAFVYRVPCGAHIVDVPEKTDLAELRVRKTAWQDYQPPAPATPLEVEVDSPLGTFESGGDSLRVALDDNMDEQLGPEAGLRFALDRQVEVYLQVLGEDGAMALDTRVADHQLALATERLQNVRVRVHGRLTAGQSHTDSRPITLNIDGAGPRIHFVEVAPWDGFVVAGTELQVAALVTDAMSGVKTVEVGFDVDGTGQFSDEAPPVSAVLDPAVYSIDPQGNLSGSAVALADDEAGRSRTQPQRWIAKLATDSVLGVQTLLIRATDQVGNAGEFYPQRVQILTEEQAAARIQQQAKSIEGTVIFRGQPVPKAVLTLFGPEQTEIATTRAGEDGSFAFATVPVGEYQLSAEGVIHNVPRFGLQPVVVELMPGRAARADVRLE